MYLSSSSNERIYLCLFRIAATFGSPRLKSQTQGKTLSIVVSKFLSGSRRLSLSLDSSFSKASCDFICIFTSLNYYLILTIYILSVCSQIPMKLLHLPLAINLQRFIKLSL